MILLFGADIDDYTPAAKQLKSELKRARFRLSEIEVLSDPRDIQGKGECYILAFGATAYSELTGRTGLSNNRGMLHSCQWSENALVFPTFTPGYLYRNPQMRGVFRNDLETFRAFIALDRDGVIV